MLEIVQWPRRKLMKEDCPIYSLLKWNMIKYAALIKEIFALQRLATGKFYYNLGQLPKQAPLFNLLIRTHTSSIDQITFVSTVFPTGCTSYRGPHSIECLDSIWKEAMCVEEGEDYPSRLTDVDLFRFMGINIAWVLLFFAVLIPHEVPAAFGCMVGEVCKKISRLTKSHFCTNIFKFKIIPVVNWNRSVKRKTLIT